MARRRISLWSGLALMAAMLGSMAWSFAPDPGSAAAAKLLPANAVLYLGVDGQLAHQAAFEKTAAYEALQGSGLLDTVKKGIERLQEQAQNEGVDPALSGLLLRIGKHILDHGLSVAAAIEPNTAGGPPVAFAVLVLHDAGEFREVIEGGLQQMLQGEVTFDTGTKHGRQVTSGQIPGTPGVDVGWWVENEAHFVLAVGINGVESALRVADGSAANITTNSMFQKYSSPSGFEQNVLGFLDFASLRKSFGPMPLPPTPAGRTVTVNEFLKALGLDTLNAAVAQSGYKGRACWSELTIEAPGPRTGLLALIDQPSFTINDLPPLPPNFLNLIAVGIDGGKTYDTVYGVFKNVMDLVEPNAIGEIVNNQQQAEQFIGFRFKEDLFGTVQGVACLNVDGANLQSLNFNGLGLSIGLNDGDRLRTSLQKIFDLINQEARGDVVFEKTAKHGRDLHLLKIREFGLISPTFCIDKNRLHIALTPQAIDSALLRADGKLPAWKPSQAQSEGFAELPQTFTHLSISDTPTLYRQFFTVAPMLLGLADTALRQNANSDFRLPVRPEELPSAELIAQPLFPNMTAGTVDANGAKQTSRTSLPGLEVGSSAAVVAIGVALLLPVVQQSRGAAREAQSKNNLKQLGLALHNYHDVFNKFPQGVRENEKLKLEQRLSWLYSVLPYLDQAPVFNQFDQDEAWDSTTNKPLADRVIPVFINPAVSAGPGQPASSHYVGLAGIGKDGPKLPVTDPKAGFFGNDRSSSLRDITDGSSNTIAVAESDGGERPWAHGTASIQPLTQQPYIGGPDGIGGVQRGGVNVLFADGSVKFISGDIDASVMEALVTIRGGEAVDDF